MMELESDKPTLATSSTNRLGVSARIGISSTSLVCLAPGQQVTLVQCDLIVDDLVSGGPEHHRLGWEVGKSS